MVKFYNFQNSNEIRADISEVLRKDAEELGQYFDSVNRESADFISATSISEKFLLKGIRSKSRSHRHHTLLKGMVNV